MFKYMLYSTGKLIMLPVGTKIKGNGYLRLNQWAYYSSFLQSLPLISVKNRIGVYSQISIYFEKKPKFHYL